MRVYACACEIYSDRLTCDGTRHADLVHTSGRFDAAKLLLELGEEEHAVAILEDINEEHDMNPDGAYRCE